MPNYSQCFASASAAAGRQLKPEELDTLFDRAQSRIGVYMREGMTARDAAIRAGKELGVEAQFKRAREARAAKTNLVIQQTLKAREVPEREYDTLMAAITGVEKSAGDTLAGVLKGTNKGTNFEGAADSADARGNAAVGKTLGAMEKELRGSKYGNLLPVLLKGDKKFSRDLANEIGRLDDPNFGRDTGNKFAKEAARIIKKYVEDVRNQQNAAGAWIGKLDQYVTRQSHDADLIRGDGTPADYARWRDTIQPLLDDRTFLDHDAPADRETFLRGVYNNLASGDHEGAVGADWLGGFRGDSSLASKVSAERKLFFKNADAWFDYNVQKMVSIAADERCDSRNFKSIKFGWRF